MFALDGRRHVDDSVDEFRLLDFGMQLPAPLELFTGQQVAVFQRRQSLAKVDAPTLLGEMSLITDRPTSATVMALSECELQLLTKAQFQRLIAADSIAAYRLVVIIAGVAWAAWYYLIGQNYVSTDDAYVAAESAQVTPQISASVIEVKVKELLASL